MRWLWPRSLAEDTVLVRLGRVLHWGFVVAGVLAFLYGGLVAADTWHQWQAQKADLPPLPAGFVVVGQEPWRLWATVGLGGLAGFLLALVGRSIRYVLAGE